MPIDIDVSGLKFWEGNLAKAPAEIQKAAREAMEKSLLHVQGSVPSYPPPPATSTYDRSGTLGRTLGASMGGQPIGAADIQQVKQLGPDMLEGRFGTRLDYAPYVIGEREQAGHMKHWWTIKTVARKAKKGVIRIWQQMADQVARRLNR